MEGGLDLEKQTSIPVEAELFSLTSLFIELIDPGRSSSLSLAWATVDCILVRLGSSASPQSGHRVTEAYFRKMYKFEQSLESLTGTVFIIWEPGTALMG